MFCSIPQGSSMRQELLHLRYNCVDNLHKNIVIGYLDFIGGALSKVYVYLTTRRLIFRFLNKLRETSLFI